MTSFPHRDEYVCAACIDDEGIGDFISKNADSHTCSFCGATSAEPIAAPLIDVIDYLQQCIAPYYDDPANELSYDGAEGGYLGETYTTDELFAEIGLYLPNDENGQLFEALVNGMENDLWCATDPYGMSPVEQLNFSWDAFCELIKHKRRYFFLNEQRADEELFSPAEILRRIFSFAESTELFVSLPSGTALFRARKQRSDKPYTSSLELGPPPTEAAIQTNRMSPPGIVMMYASEEANTALAETADGPGKYAVGEFETTREALILRSNATSTRPFDI